MEKGCLEGFSGRHDGCCKMSIVEAPLDPDRPIIDPHLHFWHILPAPNSPQSPQRFLLEDAASLIETSGHNITHSVFIECHAMYRADGPDELRSLGETEFANGVAAMSASGGYGSSRLAHRIVGNVDLRLGSGVRSVLEKHVAAAGERFCGIRMNTAWAASGLFGLPCDPAAKGVLIEPSFIEGARALANMGLSLDVWCVHSQLADLATLADRVPELTLILDHIGTPERLGSWANRPEEARAQWSASIQDLAKRPNVLVKIGGLGMDLSRSIPAITGHAHSSELARDWAPLIDTCIEAFGPQRAMFESNFPPDRAAADYGTIWNAFKRATADLSENDKDWLFRRTAARAYHIDLGALAADG